MAWISVKELGQKAKSENNTEERTALRVFQAISDTPTTTVAAETASDGVTTIPVKYATHPNDATRKVRSKNATPDEESNRTVFYVEVNYSSKGKEKVENPLDRPAEFDWSFDDGTETYFLDRGENGDGVDPFPTVNSAGERFEELLERETGSITCTITKNIAHNAYSPTNALFMKDALNDSSITVDGVVVGAYQAKCKGWTCGAVQEENGTQFRVSKVVLQFRRTWDHVVEDRGFNEKDGSTGKLKEIVKGTPPTKVDQPWPLDAAGAAKPNADDPADTLTFYPYYAETYVGLPIA
jgi:hypothetical protein